MLPKTNIGTPIILTVFLLTACAGVSQQVPLKTMVQEADSRVGQPVTLGGYILDTRTVRDSFARE